MMSYRVGKSGVYKVKKGAKRGRRKTYRTKAAAKRAMKKR